MAEVRIPPHSEEAEASVIGSILIDKDAIVAVAEFLRPEHFYIEANRVIFEGCLELYEERKPIDVVTLKEKLKKQKNLSKAGGATYLTSLVNRVPTSAHVENYARIVQDNYTKRELISAAGKIVEEAFSEEGEADKVLDKAEQSVFSLSQKHLKQIFLPVKDILAESFDRLDELHKKAGGLRGVPTGFKDLDDTLAGMQDSNLLILAARPGIGKTALALNIGQFVAVKVGIPVGFFSLEMSKEELVDRLLVKQADIDAWRLKTGRLDEDDFSRLSVAMGELAEAPFYIDDTPALSVLEMRTKARRLMAEKGLRLLVVDYLQLMRSIRPRESRVQEVSEISQGLKNLARELKVPLLAVSQLSREVEKRGTRRPQLADLRECLVGETLVADADSGERSSLKELYLSGRKIRLLAMDKKGRLEPIAARQVTCSGKKTVFTLTTRSGREIKASGNHPFLTPEGWKSLSSLSAGTLIAVPRLLPFSFKNTLSLSRARFLGYLVSDGSYKKYRTCGFTNSDLVVARDAMTIAAREFGVECRTDGHNNSCNIDFVSTDKRGYGKPGGNRLINWLKTLGIYGQGTGEKRVPKIISGAADASIAQFLKGLFTGDGTLVHRKTGRWEIKYAAKNKDLILDVFHLLLRLGISASIRQGRKGKFGIFYLEIDDRDTILEFLKKVGFVGKKQIRAVLCQKELRKKATNPRNNLYPIGVTLKVAELKNKLGLSWRELGYRCQGKRMSREWLTRVAEVLGDEKLKQMAESELHWEKIKSITPVGKAMTYDITVPGHHNFVANDILVHNSGAIEQDSDVVMFLWREDEEDLENVELEIAKHRNGPLRRLRLHFRGDRISFYGVERRKKEE
jgi:replicative DNA helicase